MVHALWRQFPRINLKLTALEPYLLKAVNLSNQPIHHKITQLLKSGGKFLRPGFFYIYSEFGEKIDPAKVKAGAAAVELLHVATLIHDDVIDESPLRRGVETIQVKYGQKHAIYAGDYLFTCYFTQVLKSTQEPADMKRHVDAMQIILAGELDQMQYNFNQKMTEADYFQEITGKTAELFKLCFQQSAIITHASDEIVELGGEVGLTIGQAYQILDDILDYSGSSKQTKKPVLEDLKSGVYTLPLIFANQLDHQDLKPLLDKREQLSDEDIAKIQKIVISSGGLEKAIQTADSLTDKALGLINQLPEQKAKHDLEKLTKMLLTRKQ